MDSQSEACRIKEEIARIEAQIAGQERLVGALILQGFSISAANEKLLELLAERDAHQLRLRRHEMAKSQS